jgi:serine/threonine-protein kinase
LDEEMDSPAEPDDRLRAALADRYAIEDEIGQGGMATVYRAHDLKHRRKVAVKVLHPELTAVLGRERFLNEIEVTAQLQHPHILPLHDSGEADGFLYYVMPYVEGESLREKMAREKQLSVEEALKIATEVADALGSAHKRGVVHRDIKPENILLGEGHALVADFGVALAVRAASGDRLTATGLSVGTPAYMSPEQVSGEEEIDGRADVYSLACVLYEMLVGEPVFTGPNSQIVLARHLAAPVPSVATARAGVPRPVAAAIEKALGKAPADRPGTAAAFREALFAEAAETEPKSIAVLPFENMSADPENEFFSDGITEEIINALSKVRGLRVPARTSSFTFKGKTVDIREVGRKLDVATVLEGSVRKAGNRLRVTAQLINVADGYHLWSERYDREVTDVFAVQDEIAATVVNKLEVSLLGAPETGTRGRHTDDLEAYELYLRGRHLLNQRGPWTAKALECFERAVGRDPAYALAHASIAVAHTLIGFFGGLKHRDAFHKGRAAARRALDLDPMLPEAHGALGFNAIFGDWDWSFAERELLRAVELDPGYVDAHRWYGVYLGWTKGDLEAGIRQFRHALKLDPLSAPNLAYLAAFLIQIGRLEEGILEAERAMELAPTLHLPYEFKAWALRAMARHEEALDVLEQGIALTGGGLRLGEVALTHAHAGRFQEARAILEKETLPDVMPAYAAVVYGAMGDFDATFGLMAKALTERDPNLACIWGHPDSPVYLDDPRARDLIRRLGLPNPED